MTDRAATTKLWAQVLSGDTEPGMAAVAETMADGVTSVSPAASAEGKDAVLAELGQFPLSPLLAQAAWSEPKQDGDRWSTSCRLAPTAPVGGVTLELTFDSSDRVIRAVTMIDPAPPPTATSLVLTDAIKAAVNGALANQTPFMV